MKKKMVYKKNVSIDKVKEELKGDKIIACYDFEVKISMQKKFEDLRDKFKFVIIGDKVSYRGLPYIDSENKDSELIVKLWSNNSSTFTIDSKERQITYRVEFEDRRITYNDLIKKELTINSANKINFPQMCEAWIKAQVKELTSIHCSYKMDIGDYNQPVNVVPAELDIKNVFYYGTGMYNALNFRYYRKEVDLWYHCSIIGDKDIETTKDSLEFPVGKTSIRIIEYPIINYWGLHPLNDIYEQVITIKHSFKMADGTTGNITLARDSAVTNVLHKYNGPNYKADPNYNELIDKEYSYIHKHTLTECVKKILNYGEDHNLEIEYKL